MRESPDIPAPQATRAAQRGGPGALVLVFEALQTTGPFVICGAYHASLALAPVAAAHDLRFRRLLRLTVDGHHVGH
jgi:hypothetical protein